MNLNIPPAQLLNCEQFIDRGGTMLTKTVVITPLRVMFQSDDAYKISFGCNFWKSCTNMQCSYCKLASDEAKGNELEDKVKFRHHYEDDVPNFGRL